VAAQLRDVSRQLDDLKQATALLLADNADLKTRLRDMSQAMEHLAARRVEKPVKPKLIELPEPLPELKPLPEN
jgi:hypothetical protein